MYICLIASLKPLWLIVYLEEKETDRTVKDSEEIMLRVKKKENKEMPAHRKHQPCFL